MNRWRSCELFRGKWTLYVGADESAIYRDNFCKCFRALGQVRSGLDQLPGFKAVSVWNICVFPPNIDEAAAKMRAVVFKFTFIYLRGFTGRGRRRRSLNCKCMD